MPTPWNNPYIPGDPYSYDLKWLVQRVKEHGEILATLDERIAAAVQEFLDQHDPIYYKTAAELIASPIKGGMLTYIQGYNEPGDGGANLYYVTTDYNDVLNADYYLTLDDANRWAILVLTTPYVTPEMFGAKGDGTTDDGSAFETALKFGAVKLMPGKTYEVDYQNDVVLPGPVYLCGNYATVNGFTVKADGINGITIEKLNIKDANKSLNFDNCQNVKVSDCTFAGEPSFQSPRFVILRNCEHVSVNNCYVQNTQYGVFMQVYQLGRSKDVSVSNCKFVNTQRYSYPAGVSVYEATDVRVSDCYFEYFQHDVAPYADGYGVYSGDYEYNDIGAITVENCQFDNCGRGIRIHHSSALNISNCKITNAIQQAIMVDANESLTGDPMNNAVIANNVLTSYIDVGGACDNALVTGNDITGTYGVFFGPAGTPAISPKKPSIIGNHIHDTERGGIAIDIAESPVVISNDITNFNTSAYTSSDYRSAGIGFNTGTTNPSAIGNVIREPAASTFGINFANTSTKRVYKANSFDMATNSILGGYTGAPAQGKWARGESVDYVNPASPNYFGAVCTASGDFAGTPPTFKQYGALA